MPPPRRPATEEDFGFVPDEAGDNFGFVPAAPEAATPPRMAVTSRILELPETSFEVDPTGRRPDIVSQRGEFTEMRNVEPVQSMMSPTGRVGDVAVSREAEARGAGFFRPGEAPPPLTSAQLSGPEQTWTERRLAHARRFNPATAAETVLRGPWHGFADELLAGASTAGMGAGDVLRRVPGLPEVLGPAIQPVAQAARNAGVPGFDPELVNASPDERYDRVRRALAERAARQSEREPESVGAGEVAYAAPMMAVGGPPGASWLERAARMGALAGGSGMLTAAGESEAESPLGQALDIGAAGFTQGTLGFAGQAVGEGIGGALSRIGRWAANRVPEVADAAARARIEAAGLNPTPAPRTRYGRHIQRLGGPQRVAEMLNAENVGGRFLPTAEAVPESVERLGRSSGAQMDEVVRAMDEAAQATGGRRGTVPTADYVGGIEDAARELERVRTEPTQRAAQLLRGRYIEPQVASEGPMPRPLAQPRMGWQQAHDLRQALSEQGGLYNRATDPGESTAAGAAVEARDTLAQLMNRAAEDVDPSVRDLWRTANRRYSLRELLGENSTASPRRLMPAIAAGAQAAMSGNPVNQAGTQAAAGLWARYGPGVRARSLQALVPALRGMGPRAASWANVLEQAAVRGNVALAAAHYALSRSNPEYRQAVEAMQEEGQ